MANHLSVATVIEKNKIASNYAMLMALEIEVINPDTGVAVEMLRLVNNSEAVVFQGNEYSAFKFDINLKAEKGAIPQVTIGVTDLSGEIQSRMQAYGGGVGFNVTVIVINMGNLTQPAEVSETYQITGATTEGYIVNWTLGAENPLTMRFPKRRQFRDRCAWRYKGVECAYVGPLASCDFTLQGPNGCAVHENTPRYGGFPGLARPSL